MSGSCRVENFTVTTYPRDLYAADSAEPLRFRLDQLMQLSLSCNASTGVGFWEQLLHYIWADEIVEVWSIFCRSLQMLRDVFLTLVI